ncbi:cation-translocating P-type ATPase [Ureaplasma sp. ES3154-GEN]|uniref:heavy metal translocating P-type ATPase n=1 Tax=Ureaplasma sp. ES3154-GEN TaxID=2984844 RepID=UPI0021E9895E|nr:cation-translocating P-type ATPase [Ureaplasma sp. ES3154-GEN]MCV3743736.1 cation-translocating P-type ATPase [Ureaplasma sp. ES3154-GEN]
MRILSSLTLKWKKWSLVKKQYVKELSVVLLALIISIPLMVLEMVIMFSKHTLFSPNQYLIYSWVIFVLSTFVIFGIGYQFYRDAFFEVFKWKKIGINLLVVISTLVAYIYSLYATINNQIHYDVLTMGFFETACMIIATMSVGHVVNARIKLKANQDIEELNNLEVKTYNAYDEKTKNYTTKVVFSAKVNDLVYVRKGEVIPFDGQLISAFADVDESTLTGEARPILKSAGHDLIGGSVNLGESFVFRITKRYNDSTIHKILTRISNIEQTKPKIQKLADKIALWFTPLIILMSILSFVLQVVFPSIQTWDVYFLSKNHNIGHLMVDKHYISLEGIVVDYNKAVHIAISVLVISCPCAFGIAIPLAVLIGSAKAAKNGIVFNNAKVFEKIKKINAVAFDKTGTLTTGVLVVDKILGNKDYLSLIYQLESVSLHPLAKSYVSYCLQNNIPIGTNELEIKEQSGVGVIAHDYQNNEYLLTNRHYLETNNYDFSMFRETELNSVIKSELISTVYLAINRQVVSIIVFTDQIRDDAKDSIALLKARGISTYIISGDNEATVKYLADELGVDAYYSQVKPEEKANIVSQIQQTNKVVMYVGDGINDLLALKQADLAISIGVHNQAANAVSDINLVNADIINIFKLIMITKKTKFFIWTNLFWAFAYNILFIPLAVLGIIPPFISILIMTTSDIAVVSNSLLFRILKIHLVSKKEIKKYQLTKLVDRYV